MSAETTPGPIGTLSELFGVSPPALRVLISLLIGYPIALFHRKYLYGKDAYFQYLYFIFTGFGLGYYNFGVDAFHAVFAVVFTYVTLLIFGGTTVAVVLTFIFNMSYLLIGYHYSGTFEYDINWTVPQCVLVLRLIGIAFDLYDGRQPIDSLSADNKKVVLMKRPGFLEFCAHMFFPTCFLIGPQFPMRRFQDFVNGEFSNKEDPTRPPNSTAYALQRLGLAVMYLCVFLVVGMYVNDEYILSDDYIDQPFFKKCLILGVWGRLTLYKYISCWLFAEGGCVLFGLTHNGEDENGKTLWNGLENVKLSILENTTEFNHYIQSFNVNTNHWVLQYIYKRLKFLGNRYISQAAALTFLAVWHGFHTGYYVCFLFEFLVMFLEKDLQSILKRNEKISEALHRQPLSTIIHILLRLYTFVFMGWCLAPFALLTYDRYWKVFGAVNYMGIVLFVPWAFLYGPLLRLIIVKRKREEHTQ